MKTMHLFAGAGGGLLADLILGHDPIIAVEWDGYACQVLRERAADGWFPNLHVWEGDVRLFDPSEYAGRVDCIHAGFPCQDISVAGKQAGVGEETRSGLYREVLRIAGVVRPRYLFLENVAAIVSNGLDTVIADLTKIGYDTEWLCLRASDCGANHHRDRWWLLADSNRKSRSQAIKETGPIGNKWYSREDACWSAWGNVTDSNSPQFKGMCCSIGRVEEYADIRMGSWWKNQPAIHGVDDGVAFGFYRLKAIGNGQVPLQAAVAWKLLGGE